MTNLLVVILTMVILGGVMTYFMGVSRKRQELSDAGMVVMLAGMTLDQWVTANPYYLLRWFTTGCTALVILLTWHADTAFSSRPQRINAKSWSSACYGYDNQMKSPLTMHMRFGIVFLAALSALATTALANQITAVSGDVRATLTFMMRPSGFAGEADYGPVVREGRLTITRRGKVAAVIPLDRLGLRDSPTVFETDPTQGCGTTAPLLFFRSAVAQYLVLESVWVGKGCRAVVHLVDLGSLRVLPELIVDHAYQHRYEVPRPRKFFRETTLRVTSVETLTLRTPPPDEVSTPWTMTVIRGRTSKPAAFAGFVEDLAAENTPAPGEVVKLGSLDTAAVEPAVIRLAAAHEAAWMAQQKPMSQRALHAYLYNEYFTYSSKLAERGQFVDALAAYKTALSYLDDAELRARELTRIPKLEKLIRDVRSGALTWAKAKRLWFGL